MLIAAIICFVFTVVGITITATGQGEALAPTIMFAVLSFVFYLISRRKKSRREETPKDYTLKAVMEHLTGLPIAEGALCTIYLKNDGYEFERNNQKFKLNFNKVRDVAVKSTSEIQSSYVSSAGGAIGGAMLFGPLGAIIGGRAKKKTSGSFSSCLIFVAETEEGMKCISFNSSYYNKANKFVDAFQNIEKESIVTEL